MSLFDIVAGIILTATGILMIYGIYQLQADKEKGKRNGIR